MPASASCFARAVDMCPIEAQRLRFVCSATSFAPATTFSKSRLESPWPCVTMQNRCAPAASAALACSRICSGSIIACIGVSASAKPDCAQNPQSSAQPPDFALTSEQRSVESPKCSWRASHARSTSASIAPWSSSSPSARASARVMSGAMAADVKSPPGRVMVGGGMRDETDDERYDRNLVELLQEVRVAQTGVQILFAFLLTLPFAQRFTRLDSFERGLYLVTLCFATAASLLMIAPVAYHRLVFQRRVKRPPRHRPNKLSLAGLACLALAMTSGVFLIVHFLFGTLAVVLTVGGMLVIVFSTWLFLPLHRR